MDDQLYRDIILEHWKNPQNWGEVTNAQIDILDNNPLCGDEIRITALLENQRIKEVKFINQGCAISTAAASILTSQVQGASLNEVGKITQQDFLDLLEVKLSPSRIKCALLSYSALKKGLKKLNSD